MDYSKLIYDLLKEGKSGMDIVYLLQEKIFDKHITIYDIIGYILKFITSDSWLWNNPFEFLEFVYMLPFDIQIGSLFREFVFSYPIIHYKEEYEDIVKNVISHYIHKFNSTELYWLLVVFNQYLNEESLLDIYVDCDVAELNFKVLLKLLGKEELYDKFLFIKKLNNS